MNATFRRPLLGDRRGTKRLGQHRAILLDAATAIVGSTGSFCGWGDGGNGTMLRRVRPGWPEGWSRTPLLLLYRFLYSEDWWTNGNAVRITYWLTPDRRIVLLTVFRKTRQRQSAEVERAHQAQKEYQAHHSPAAHSYDRIREDRP